LLFNFITDQKKGNNEYKIAEIKFLEKYEVKDTIKTL